MKEIKFKCWFESSKIMSREFSIEDIKNSEVDLIDGATYLQYTGLKDKNGKEIYEGDICKYRTGKDYKYGIVKFIKDYAMYRIVGKQNEWSDLTSVEIVGNIYEKPELLEETER